MPFDAAAELQAAKEAYIANASYEEHHSASEAQAFISACRKLVFLIPKSGGHGSANATFSPELIKDQQIAAQQWLAVNGGSQSGSGGSGGYGYFSTQNFRD